MANIFSVWLKNLMQCWEMRWHSEVFRLRSCITTTMMMISENIYVSSLTKRWGPPPQNDNLLDFKTVPDHKFVLTFRINLLPPF
jgi:hypothetical protein